MKLLARVERLVQLARAGLFGVLFIMNNDSGQTKWLFLFSSFMNFIQLLQFPLADRKGFPWQTPRQTGMKICTFSMKYMLNFLGINSENVGGRRTPPLELQPFLLALPPCLCAPLPCPALSRRNSTSLRSLL